MKVITRKKEFAHHKVADDPNECHETKRAWETADTSRHEAILIDKIQLWARLSWTGIVDKEFDSDSWSGSQSQKDIRKGSDLLVNLNLS